MPGLCADCCRLYLTGALQDARRCPACALRVPEGVRLCATCQREPPLMVATRTAVDYDFPWDQLLVRLKFRGQLDLAPSLAFLMAEAMRPSAQEVDRVLPMPLSAARLRQRGFNQAWELARRVARQLALPAQPHVLERLVDLPSQLGANRAERLARLQGVFGVAPKQLALLRGQRIALVDDVLTTGATAHEATRVLLACGAASVQLWTLARTPAPEPGAD